MTSFIDSIADAMLAGAKPEKPPLRAADADVDKPIRNYQPIFWAFNTRTPFVMAGVNPRESFFVDVYRAVYDGKVHYSNPAASREAADKLAKVVRRDNRAIKAQCRLRITFKPCAFTAPEADHYSVIARHKKSELREWVTVNLKSEFFACSVSPPLRWSTIEAVKELIGVMRDSLPKHNLTIARVYQGRFCEVDDNDVPLYPRL